MKQLAIIFLTVILLSLGLIFPSDILAACSLTFPLGGQVKPGESVSVKVNNLSCIPILYRWYSVDIIDSSGNEIFGCAKRNGPETYLTCFPPGTKSWTFSINIPAGAPEGSYQIKVYENRCITLGGRSGPICSGTFGVSKTASTLHPPGTPLGNCRGSPEMIRECEDCILNKKGSWTAIGCLPTGDPRQFLAWMISRAVGVSGGIALLLIIWGGFQVILSSGNPEKLQKGKEILTSAIIGLLFIIFSIFILRFIGVQIFQIPEFDWPAGHF